MKKFGLLTFYNEHNYGAVLQAYALQKSIKRLGYSGEFINYAAHFPSHHVGKTNVFVRLKNKISIFFSIFKYLKVRGAMVGNNLLFNDFQKTYLKIAHNTLYDNDDLDACSNCYQGFIAGSDMVWTPIGQDLNYYFMRFAPIEKRLSYAASLTGTNRFDSDTDKKISQYISEVCSIACREKEGVNYVQNKTGRKATQTVDPTLLLTKEDWISAFDLKADIEDRYILCYVFKGLPRAVFSEIKRVAKEKHMKVRYVPMNIDEYYHEVKNGYSGAYGPKEFVGLFMNASFVVTNSFHGFLFSLISRKPFVVIHREKGNKWKANEGRISNLLDLLELSCRYIEPGEKLTDELLELDYTKGVDDKIECLRSASLSYLNEMLSKAADKENPRQEIDYLKVTDLSVKQCTGCEACVSVCPKECIQMQPDKEGFMFPYIDENECVNCGKCVKDCPSIHNCDFRHEPLESYAALSNLDEVEKSASGGLFVTAAKYVIEECKGVVFGVVLDQKTFECRFDETETLDGLRPMQNSKYIQAHVGKVYDKVKSYLFAGRTVLFTGTPCHIAGLKTFLGKEFENLYTIDIICHGVPSQMYWQKYINNTYPEKSLQFFQFRNRDAKRQGRTSLECVVVANGTRRVKNAWDDVFYGSFVENESFRMSCYYCKFANDKRCGDLTMGDFDSTYQLPDFYPSECRSVVAINNDSGKKLWDAISKQFLFRPISFIEEAKVNATLMHPSPMPVTRSSIYKDLNFISWSDFKKKYSHKQSKVVRVKSLLSRLIRG